MTKKSKDKIFGALDPEKKKNRSTENELMSFLAQDSISAIGIVMQDQAVILLYEEI
jgi:hypothetical protein